MAFDLKSLAVGQELKSPMRYKITEAHYQAFTSVFEDISPVHIDDAFARQNGFREKVMHGSILNGFISHFVGMFFPGSQGFLLSSNVKYLLPNYLNDEYILTGTVKAVSESMRVVDFDLRCENETQRQVTARARIQVKFLE